MKTRLTLLLFCFMMLSIPSLRVYGQLRPISPPSGKPKPPKPTTGTLSISSTPSDAAIKIDGEYMGTTPLKLKNRKPGSYSITFSAEGYETITKSVTVTAGKTATCSAQMKRKQTFSSADLWVDSVAVVEITSEQLYEEGLRYYENEEYSKAVPNFRESAEQGYALAQWILGDCYYKGQGVSQSYSNAVAWYRKAAEQGNVSAQCNLGYCYEKGQGVTQSYAEAVSWYRKAAKQGNARAQLNLGYCYDEGQGVTQSYSEAVSWYRKAAEQGNARAQYNLGVCYYEGLGVAIDKQEAKKWFERSAAKGITYAKDALDNYTF